MNNKKLSTQSTFIFAGDTSIGSLGISRIEPKKTMYPIKRLSYSLENLRNPFPQILPLKFPKKRIIKGCSSHMLSETVQPVHKPCLLPFKARNMHDTQVTLKKGIRIIHKTNETSQDNNINQSFHRSLSNSSSENKSFEKHSKRIYHHMFIKESAKDPILIGQMHQNSVAKGKRQFQNESQRKNHGQGTKSSLDWKINKSDQKMKFNSKCKAFPQILLNNINISENKCVTKRNSYKNKQTIKQRLKNQNTERNVKKTARQQPISLKKKDKPKTYLEMYNSRRVTFK